MTRRAGSGKASPSTKRVADGPNPFVAAVHNIRSESGGLLDLVVVRPVDLPYVIAEAVAGTPDAVMLMIALDDTVKRITTASYRAPMSCYSCPQPLLPETFYSFAVVLPSRESPTNGLVLAVCANCGTAIEDIRARAISALHKIWPDLSSRPITVTHPAGGQA